MNDLRDYIWNRQYAQTPDESYRDGLRRVARHIAQAETRYGEDPQVWEERFFALMDTGQFVPGGRILAGAGSEHGNLLNCFVVDGAPETPGSTDWVLHLAKKLALITKVGGGTGLNLDPIAPKKPYNGPVGRLFLHINSDHPDADDVYAGRITDRYTGEKVERDYREAQGGRGPDNAHILSVPDSIEGIWEAAGEMVRLLLSGKDVTVDLSALRPEGAPVKGSGGTSSGPASFAVEIFDNFAYWARLGAAEYAGPVATLRYVFAPTLRAIRQGGTRRGAGMATLSIEHPDWEDFLTAKDLDREAAEGDISTYNISFLVPDDFMRHAQEDVLRRIAEHAHATGEPGLIFVDTVNRHNPLAEVDGSIVATNPCGEIPLYPGEPCDLGHLNLPAFVRDGQVDYPALERATKLAVRFLDDVLDVEKSPLPDISNAIQDKRRIGLGVMGLADLLIRLGLRYDSEEGRKLTQDVITFITRTALNTSEALAKERGIPTGVMRAGLTRRNIAVMTVAPTGTTSMLQGVSSGIEPVYAAVYKRRVGTVVKDVAHPLLLEMLEQERALEWLNDHYTPLAHPNGGWDLDLLVQALNKTHGSVLPLVQRDWLPSWFSCFLTAHDVAPLDHVRMQATVQNAFDSSGTGGGNSISKTINLPNEASVEAVLEAYSSAWELGCKGITVYRDGSRGYQVLSAGEGDFDAWADELEQRSELLEFEDGTVVDLDSRTVYQLPEPASSLRLREEVIDAHVHKYEVGGRKVYITVGWNQAKEVVELWVHLSKPTPNEAVACDIIGRLASLAFKYGASVRDVQKHLEGHYDQSGGLAHGLGFVTSIWEVVASTLEAYKAPPTTAGAESRPPSVTASAPVQAPTTVRCDCGGTLVREEGCWKCPSCGYSKCG